MSLPIAVVFPDFDADQVIVEVEAATRGKDVKEVLLAERDLIPDYTTLLFEGCEISDGTLMVDVVDACSTLEAVLSTKGRGMRVLDGIEPTLSEMLSHIKSSDGNKTEAFIDCGVAADSVDENGSTPLLVSIWFGNDTAFAILLRLSTSINYCNDWGLTPLLMACHMHRTEMVRQLLAFPGIDINKETNTRYAAINSSSGTPLHVACKKGSVDIVEMLLQDPRIDVNKQFCQVTALYVACQANLIDCVKVLLRHPAINTSDVDKNNNVIQVAEKFGFTEIKDALQNHTRNRTITV